MTGQLDAFSSLPSAVTVSAFTPFLDRRCDHRFEACILLLRRLKELAPQREGGHLPSFRAVPPTHFHRHFDALCDMQDYGAYLEADAIAAAASCREMEWALQEVFRLAEQCSDYKSNERYVCTLYHVFMFMARL